MSDSYYLDSSVFLAWLKEEEGRINSVDALFRMAKSNRLKIFTSTLTIAEVLNIQGYRQPISKQDKDRVRELFSHEWIPLISVNRRIAEISQDMVWDYGIKPKDGIHVATAIVHEATVLYSYDKAIIDKEYLKTIHGATKISEPPKPEQFELSFA